MYVFRLCATSDLLGYISKTAVPICVRMMS